MSQMSYKTNCGGQVTVWSRFQEIKELYMQIFPIIREMRTIDDIIEVRMPYINRFVSSFLFLKK